MNSEILDQLTNLKKNVNSDVTKPKRGRKKKIDPKINEVEENDVREQRERLVVCVLSGTSKQYSSIVLGVYQTIFPTFQFYCSVGLPDCIFIALLAL